MPRVVDDRERSRLLTDAVVGIVLRGGREAVTLQAVADAAGVRLSAVRHTCHTREDLLTRAVVDLSIRRERTRRAAGLRLWEATRVRRGPAPADRLVDYLADYLVESELPVSPEELDATAAWLLLSTWPGLNSRARRCAEADSADQRGLLPGRRRGR